MNIISNLQIFDANLPNPEFIGGMERQYYRRRRGAFSVVQFSLGGEDAGPIYCGIISKVNLLPGAHYCREGANFLSVEYIRRGTLKFRQNQHAWQLEDGELFLMRPKVRCEFMTGPGEICEKYSLTFYGVLVDEYLRATKLDSVDVIPNADPVQLEELLREFEAVAQLSPDEAKRENELLTFKFLRFLREPALPRPLPPQIARLREFLENRLREPLNLETMSRFCGCSPTHLVRTCRQILDVTPYQLLIRLRMRRAAQLLITDDSLSIKEITLQVGYQNAFNFSTEFHRFFGVSPREYRKKHMVL